MQGNFLAFVSAKMIEKKNVFNWHFEAHLSIFFLDRAQLSANELTKFKNLQKQVVAQVTVLDNS